MQKLVTVYLDNSAYSKGKMIIKLDDKHGLVEEHLQSFLEDGWRIITIHGFGGSSENASVRGWITVVLEKTP